MVKNRASLVAVSVAALWASGCAQPNAMSRRNALVGSLRESVGQLETEKQDLERQVADLTASQRRLEDRLVREQAHSEDLASRLEDARRVARDGGRSGGMAEVDDEDLPPRRRTVPSNQPARRKTPFAQIPGEVRPLPSDDGDSFSRPKRTPREDEPDSALFSDDGETQAKRDPERNRWMSVARDDDEDASSR